MFLGWAAVIGAAALAVARRDARLVALAALGAAGVMRARAARLADAACVAAAAGSPGASGPARVFSVVLDAAAAPGTRARGALLDRGCRVRATLLVERGSAPAGARVAVRGTVTKSGGVVLVQQAVVAPLAAPTLTRRMRERAGAAIDRTFGDDAPLARALLIADVGTLDAGVRARYADAGIVHLLSVSGLHVAIIAGAVELLLGAARVSRAGAAWLSLLITGAYVVVIGAPAPAVRAAVMLGVGAASGLAQRPTSPWAALAVGAAVPLIDARVVTDLGYQLSVSGLAALIAAAALARRLLAGRLEGWRRTVARDLLASVLASIVTLPLIAWTFGRVSLIAPVANLAAGPLFAVLQPALFLGLVLSPFPPVATLVADAAHALLGAVDLVAALASRVPFAAVSIAPTLWSAVLLGVTAAAIVVACSSRPEGAWFSRALLAGVTAVCALVVGVEVGPRAGLVELHAIDVGQGDAIALRTPRGRWVLFDAGRSWSGGDAGRSTVVPYLRRRGGALHAFVLSHPHADHVGGAATVLGALRPKFYWDAAYVAASESYRASLEAAARGGVAWRRVHPGDSIALDGVRISFLAPDSAWTASLADANEASSVALVRYGGVRFLLVGDAERGEEAWLLARRADGLRADVLKVGHHGSSTSSTPEFLDAVRPRVAVISVGVANSYRHPSPVVVAALSARGAQVLRTDHLGSIVVRSDGRSLTMDAAGERWAR